MAGEDGGVAPGAGPAMELYSDRDDPVCHAVRLVLAEKGVGFLLHDVGAQAERPEALRTLNPYASVLTLIDRDLVLYEPQVILEYLDERFPHPALMPDDPISRARNRLLRYRVVRDLHPLMLRIEDSAQACDLIRRRVTELAPVFGRHRYFFSERYTLLDCLFAPVLWRAPLYGLTLEGDCAVLGRYGQRIFRRHAFATSLITGDKMEIEAQDAPRRQRRRR